MVEEHSHGEGVSPLHHAVKEGDVLACEHLIEELKIDVDIRNTDEETPLHTAVKAGQFPIAFYLLKNGANPTSANSTGATALHYVAGKTGSKELMNLLISSGADVNAVSESCATPLHCAACGNEEAVRILLANAADPNMKIQSVHTPLGYSIINRSFQCVKLLVEAGADVKTSSGGKTLLQLAASNEDNEILKYLLDSGADPNFYNIYVQPLEIAASRLNFEAVEILFPVTDPLPYISEWSIGGVIRHFTDITNSQEEDTLSDLEEKAQAAYKIKEYSEAMSFYTEILKRKPHDKEALLYRGTCRTFLMKIRPALADADLCIETWPDDADGYSLKGLILANFTNEPAKAADAYSQALLLSPENVKIQRAYWKTIVSEFDLTLTLCDLEILVFKTRGWKWKEDSSLETQNRS